MFIRWISKPPPHEFLFSTSTTSRLENKTGPEFHCARHSSLDSTWLYTLLWSAKECLLKTPQFGAFSLWNMASMESTIEHGQERLGEVQRSSRLASDFRFLRATVATETLGARSFRMAVSGARDLVLVALTDFDSDRKIGTKT